MVYKWSDLVGQSVANLYVIKAVHAEQPDRAAFIASTQDDEVPVLLELVSPDSPDFEDQRQCWQTAANIHHESLVSILQTDGTVVDGKPMLYCAKERHDDELAVVLDSRPLTEAETRDVLGPILQCLDHIHRSNCVHGGVTPSSVLAFGDRVKLAPDTIHRSGPERPASDDIHGVGLLVMEMLTGRGAPPHMEQIGSPLREIVAACMDSKRRQSLTPANLIAMLAPPAPAEPLKPAPVAPASPRPISTVLTPVAEPVPIARQRRKNLPFAAAALVATLLIAVVWQLRKSDRPEAAPEVVVTQQQDVRPSPVVPAEPALQRRTPPVRRSTPEPGSWAVVAATYRSYEAAEKRANSLRRQWKDCDCSVYPEKGQGKSYYVVVGSGMTKNAAERLHRQARASRLPSDTYVTRLSDGGMRARQGR